MSYEVISLIALVAIFLIATILPRVQMGVLAIAATFLIGIFVVGSNTDDLAAGFPADLFLILAGVTFLFAIAKNNGTVDWLVHAAVRAVRGRISLIPWAMFLVTAALTAVGAPTLAAVAIVAPIGLGFALRHKINPVLMGLLVINGATAGGFSPISIFGGIVNTVVQRNHLPGNPTLLFVSSFVINLLLCVIVFALFGGRELLGRRVQVTDESVEHEGVPGGSGTTSTTAPPQTSTPVTSLNRYRVFTLIGILGLAGGALFFDLNVGFVAFTVAAVLTLLDPQGTKGAVSQIAWPTVLLVCGIITYVSLMQDIGTDKWLGAQVAGIGAPLIAALLICFIGGAVSAFASTTGILGALIPLAVPIILGGRIGAVGVIIALSLSSSIVDSSPFSTSGSLVVANSDEQDRDVVFRKLMIWGMSMVVVIPIVTWVVFIVPGWL